METNNIQKIQLDLIKSIGYTDNLEGPTIAEDLTNNSNLWEGALLTNLESLVHLRDLSLNSWNRDTLYILPKTGMEVELEVLSKSWNPTEITWIGGVDASALLGSKEMDSEKQILKLWWD